MAAYGDITYDSRVRREATTLAAAGHAVTLFCLGDDASARDLPAGVTVRVVRPTTTSVLPRSANPFLGAVREPLGAVVDRLGWLSGYVRNLRAWGRLVVGEAAVDLWHLHDLTALAGVLPALPRGVPVVYDAHELFLDAGTALQLPGPVRRLLRAYERRLVSRVSAVVTVNEALATVLRRRHRPSRIVVVHNCPDRWSPPPRRPTLDPRRDRHPP